MSEQFFAIFSVFSILRLIHPAVGTLCAFGCREFPQHQIVSSAQFRSFIMPRDHDGGGCPLGTAGACGGAESAEEGVAGEGTTPEPDTGPEKAPMPDFNTLLSLKRVLLPPPPPAATEEEDDAKAAPVWYSTQN